ncbi:Serine/threonine exchanger SteT [Candidatus Izimaplasma bacterium HR1]|uniref:APC family permease n=1 Tax=Candidatus Izimoplasma sp. HR1 TaxID=1541959 RepID=UPI0004F8FF14|nr:Serine/threonine exchanger SteT [Candidatus Izimaplasma bacterium HR1]
MKELKPKYGLLTAISMVVGITIGSGVFFKADDVLAKTNGNLGLAILAWLIGGVIMILGGYTFSLIAGRVSKVNGLVDYVEAAYGETAGYLVGWFQTVIYYPTLSGILAWVAALYTDGLLGLEGTAIWYLAGFYLISIFFINYISPILAGKFQVGTTAFKLIPLVLVGVVGIIGGLINGTTIDNFTTVSTTVSQGTGLGLAVLSTAFAYEGWVIATTINKELKNPKRDLPKALFFGSLIVVGIYLFYYLGLSGVIENSVFLEQGDHAVSLAVTKLFGSFAGSILIVFVIISCLGTLNGLTMGLSRGMYSLAYRGRGPKPEFFVEVEDKHNSPRRSAVFGLIISTLWLLVWYGNFHGWFGEGNFLDTSELPIALLYTVYISIYIWLMRTFKDLNIFKRFVIPSFAILGSSFIVYSAIQKDLFIYFFIATGLILFIGYLVDNKKRTTL